MDVLDKYIEENDLTIPNILSLVDDYSIYSYYLNAELEINAKYSSPLREADDDPSFALYESRSSGDILFKDHGNGLSGDVFTFLRNYLGFNLKQVLEQINSDLELGLGSGETKAKAIPVVLKKTPMKKEKVDIRITKEAVETQEYLDYWALLDISKETRDTYYCRDTGIVHFVSKSGTRTIAPKGVVISYEIPGYYKIYQPHSPRFKFVNNYPYGYVEGAIQLRWNKPFAIITKSTKECMFFREHFDWDSVAGTSENTPISKPFMQKLFAAYPTIFIWLDNDAPGIRAQNRYIEEYPQLIPITMKKGLVAKDPTDLYFLYKKEQRQQEVLQYIEKLIYTHLEPNAEEK